MKTKIAFLLSSALSLTAYAGPHFGNGNFGVTYSTTTTNSCDIIIPDPVTPGIVSDTEFLKTAYNSMEFEIKAGKLARRMSTDKEEKKFARMMIRNDASINNEIRALLVNKGCSVPKKLPLDLKADYRILNQLMDTAFNKEYSAVIINDNQQAIKMFSQATGNSKDTDIKNLASKDLPELIMEEDSAHVVQAHVDIPRDNKSTW